MRNRRFVWAVAVLATGLLALLLSNRDRRIGPPESEGPSAARVEIDSPRRSGPRARGPDLAGFLFVLRPQGGLDVEEGLSVAFDQKTVGYRTRAVLVPDRPSEVRLAADEVRISLADDPAGLTIWPRRAELNQAPRDRPLELALCGAGSLRLVTRSGRDDRPVAGVPLAVRSTGSVEVDEKRSTAEDGTLLLEDLPVGAYRIAVRERTWTADPTGRTLVDPEYVVHVEPGTERTEKVVLYPYEPPECRVDLRITVDGRPPPPDTIRGIDLSWRGRTWDFSPVEPGRLRARGRPSVGGVREGGGSRLTVTAVGCPDFRLELPASAGREEHLSLRADLVSFSGRARGRLVGPDGRAIPGRTFRIALGYSGNASREVREVTTDDLGEFRLEHVRFPIHYHALNESPGERITPSDVAIATATEGRELSFVRHPRRDSFLLVEDAAAFGEMMEEAHSVAYVDVRSRDALGTRIRRVWATGIRLGPAAAAAGAEGRLSLGDLPLGSWDAWLLFPTRGAVNLELRVERGAAAREFPMELDPVREPLAGRLVFDRRAAADVVVIDGYLPHYLGGKIREEERDRLRRLTVDGVRCSARTDEEGAFAIGVHNAKNPWLTAILPDGTVFHLDKASFKGGGVVALVDHPGDLVVTGRLVDPRGDPVKGLHVSLTPLKGADDRARFQVPDPSHVNPRPTGRDGTFRIRGVRPGAYFLSIARVTEEDHLRDIDVLTDLNRVVDVRRLGPEGLRILVPDAKPGAGHDSSGGR